MDTLVCLYYMYHPQYRLGHDIPYKNIDQCWAVGTGKKSIQCQWHAIGKFQRQQTVFHVVKL